MKRRNVMLGLIVIALVAALATGTWAWLTANAESTNTFTAGTVKIEINEPGFTDVTGWTPGVSTDKQVSVKSNGTKKTYVRVSLTPVWGEYEGEAFIAEPSLPVDNVLLTCNTGANDDWLYVNPPAPGEGWYYYKKILAAGGETSLLLQSVTLDAAKTGDDYKNKVLRIVVNAEAVQASHEAYKDAWGLESLPVGVEIWTAAQ